VATANVTGFHLRVRRRHRLPARRMAVASEGLKRSEQMASRKIMCCTRGRRRKGGNVARTAPSSSIEEKETWRRAWAAAPVFMTGGVTRGGSAGGVFGLRQCGGHACWRRRKATRNMSAAGDACHRVYRDFDMYHSFFVHRCWWCLPVMAFSLRIAGRLEGGGWRHGARRGRVMACDIFAR